MNKKILLPLLIALIGVGAVIAYEISNGPEPTDPDKLIPDPVGPVEQIPTEIFTPAAVAPEGTSVSGRVVDLYQRPIAGATITFRCNNLSFSLGADAVSQSDGTFHFDVLSGLIDAAEAHKVKVSAVLNEMPSFLLSIEAQGYLPFQRNDIKLAPSIENTLGDQRLTPRMELAGEVRDARGNPVDDCLITLQSLARTAEERNADGGGFQRALRHEIRTDSLGSFLFDAADLRPGRYTIEAFAAERGAHYGTLELPHTEKYNITLSDSNWLRGTCLDGALNRIAGVRVTVQGTQRDADGKALTRSTYTDLEGRFYFYDLPNQAYTVNGIYNNSEVFTIGDTVMTVYPGADITLRSKSDSFGAVQGQVIDATTGLPIVDYQINTQRKADTASGASLTRPLANHQREGRFNVGMLPAGEYTVKVFADGYDETLATVTVSAGKVNLMGQVALNPLGTLRGRVIGPDDQPIAGASVQLFSPDARTRLKTIEKFRRMGGTFRPDRAPDNPVPGRIVGGGDIDPISYATSAEDGSFLMTGVGSGTFVVIARHRFQAVEQSVNVARGNSRETITLKFEQIAGLKIYIRNSRNNAVAGARIALVRSGLAPDPGMVLASGDDGTITLDALSPGNYAIWASRDEVDTRDVYAPHEEGELQSITLVAGKTTEALVEIPALLTATLTIYRDNTKLTSTALFASPPSGRGSPRSLTTNAEGALILKDVSAGLWSFRTSIEGQMLSGKLEIKDEAEFEGKVELKVVQPLPGEQAQPPTDGESGRPFPQD